MATDRPIPPALNGLLGWIQTPAAMDAIVILNKICALEIAFGGQRFPVRFAGENALVDLKETIISSIAALPAIAPYSVLANPTAATAAPIATGSPILNSTSALYYAGATYYTLSTFQANGGNSYSLIGSAGTAADGLRIKTPNTAFYVDVGTKLADALLFGSGSALTGSNTFFSVSRTAATSGKVQLDALVSGVDGADILINTRFTSGNLLVGTTSTTGLGSWGGVKIKDVLVVAGASSFAGTVGATNTTDTTSSGSGAVTTSGGLGVAKNLYVGAILNTAGRLQVMGPTVPAVRGGIEISYDTSSNNWAGVEVYTPGTTTARPILFVALDFRIYAGSSPAEAARVSSAANLLVGTTSDSGLSGGGNVHAIGKVLTDVSAQITPTTVAGLPSASASGQLAFVTDATSTAILGLGLVVVGGGANFSPVYSDGTNWRQL